MTLAMEMMLRSSLILAVGLAINALLRKQPAALRHWLLATTLLFAVVQPAFNRVLPEWKTATVNMLLPASSTGVIEFADPGLTLTAPVASGTYQSDLTGYLVSLWLVGTTVSCVLLMMGAFWLARLGRQAAPAGESWIALGEEVRIRLGLDRPVRILITTHPALLVTWGAWSPAILLPADADSWPVDRVRVVLAHEMAHLARHDWVVQLLAEVIRATQWFNPLFWIACAQLRRESEYACDDIVLESGIGGASYASHLVALARSFSVHGRTWLPAPSIARPSTLERRVRAMLNPQTDRSRVSSLRRAAVAATLLGIALPIAAATQAPSITTGKVTDPQGLPLPDATVRLASMASDAVLEARTDAGGTFQLQDVPPGDYLLSARYPGFSSQRQRVHLNGPVTFALQLQVGTLQETITVTAGVAPAAAARASSTAPTIAPPVCGTTEVGGNIKPPRKVKDVRPRFKQAWVDAGQEGKVLLQALIGTDGKVKNVEVVSPVQPDMEEEAIAAVTQWEFTPTYLNCQAIDVRMFVSVDFKLDR